MLPYWLRYDLQGRWERFSQRVRGSGLLGWTSEYPRAVAGLAAGSILALLLVAVPRLFFDRASPLYTLDQEWYYDLNTGRLFVTDGGRTPPIDAPSGPLPDGGRAGVRACVLAYVDDPNETERVIGFLETTAAKESPAGRPLPSPPKNPAMEWAKGRLIRRLSDKDWVPADSPQGQAILSEAFVPNTKGERPFYCRPK